jgi:Mg-chelatase subunit ChlI
VHDRAAAPLGDHRGQQRTVQPHRGQQVDVQVALPVLVAEVQHALGPVGLAARVGHEDVEAAQQVQRLLRERRDPVRRGDIRGHEPDRASTHRASTHRASTHRASTHRASTHRASTHRASTHRASTHRASPRRIRRRPGRGDHLGAGRGQAPHGDGADAAGAPGHQHPGPTQTRLTNRFRVHETAA